MKRMIVRFLKMLTRAWFLILFITAVLSTLFWFYSPLFGNDDDGHPFERMTPRIIVISIIVLLGLLLIMTIYMLRARREKKLVDDISSQAAEEADPSNEAVQAELSDLRDKLKKAMIKLRKSKKGRRSLYDLPWYIMIGPPGAGKTTAIVNSGLQFPLADDIGKEAVGGIGGTRNCDWWFTENAVLIDTAGRYTTQESDSEADNAGWLGFLNLLKKNRSRQPINGAMIAISLSDLSLQDEVTQMAHAKAIRRRLHELRDTLGVRFPVYVLFTKADLIAGFTEYFDDLGKDEREQVWGFTLPLDKSKGEKSPVASFDEEFGLLLGQINAQLLERMQMETDHQRRSLIQGFPGQVASVRDIAKRFLAEVFVDNRYEQRHMLRGVYFTSGTQEGTPIDRLMMSMAKTFGLGRQAIGSGRGSGRSFFLTRLFDGVIFPEAGLVSADDKVERRYKWSVRGAVAATVLIAIIVGGLWVRSFLGNRALVAQVEAEMATARDQIAAVPQSPVSDTDLPGIVDALNTLRDVPVNPTANKIKDRQARESEDPVAVSYRPDDDGSLGYGLYQGDALANEVSIAYREALNQILLPRLLLRLEDKIQAQLDVPEELYETLKVYLILGKQGKMNRDLVLSYFKDDFDTLYPGIGRDEMRSDLLFHITALASGPLDDIGLNGDLVPKAQKILAQLSPAERAYKGIIASTAAKALTDFRPSVAGGNSIGRVFVRHSGKDLSDGIPGIYTYEGFNRVFLKQAVSVAERVSDESFVLGEFGQGQFDADNLLRLTEDVLNLYYIDYIKYYEELLGDLDIVPTTELARAAEIASVLAGPGSPMEEILKSVAQQTRLTAEPQGEVDIGGLKVGLADVIKRELFEDLSVTSLRILRAVQSNTNQDGQPQKPPGGEVEDRFKFVYDLLDESGGPSQMAELKTQLQLVAKELNQNIGRTGVLELPELKAFVDRAKVVGDPIARWADQLATGAGGGANEKGRAGIDGEWKSNVLPACQEVTALYPFNRRAAGEAGLQQFRSVFGNDGLLDKFFKERLKDIVDTSQNPWVFRKINGEDLGIPNEVLLEFMRAAEIRSVFFGAGDRPNIEFQITPYLLDQGAFSAVLEVDGQSIVFTKRDAQPRPTGLKWPGSVGIGRISLQPDQSGNGTLNFDGFWGWFRLLDAAEIRTTPDPTKMRLNWSVGGRLVAYNMSIGGTNAFSLASLQQFKCPESF